MFILISDRLNDDSYHYAVRLNDDSYHLHVCFDRLNDDSYHLHEGIIILGTKTHHSELVELDSCTHVGPPL